MKFIESLEIADLGKVNQLDRVIFHANNVRMLEALT